MSDSTEFTHTVSTDGPAQGMTFSMRRRPDAPVAAGAPLVVALPGGSGYLGSHTLVAALKAGYDVRTTVRDLARSAEVRAMVTDAWRRWRGPAQPGYFVYVLEQHNGVAEQKARQRGHPVLVCPPKQNHAFARRFDDPGGYNEAGAQHGPEKFR